MDALERFQCCNNRAFTAKVVRIFVPDGDGALAASNSPMLQRGLRVAAHGFKFTDMVSERALAAVNRSVDPAIKSPPIEQLGSHSFLSKALRCHSALGRRDPRKDVSRQEAIDAGVPINAAPKQRKTNHCGGGGWSVFFKEKQQARMAVGLHLPKAEYHQWTRQLAAEFKQMSEAGAADEYHAKARMHARESRGELDDADAADLDDVVSSLHASPKGFLRTVVGDRGTVTQPFTTSDFEAQICDHLRTSRIGGYYSNQEYVRQALVDDLFIEDTSLIPDDMVMDYVPACPVAHPGLCITRDAAFFPKFDLACKELRKIMKDRLFFV